MIRPIHNYDRTQVKLIWHTCFGDSYAFIDEFFDIHSTAEGLVFDKEGLLVSMLLLLSAEYQIGGQLIPFWYVYACATLPDYRKQGIMKEMLDVAYNWSQKREFSGLILAPANHDLRTYYKNCGFKNFSNIKTFSLNVMDAPVKKTRLTTLSIRQVRHLRRSYFGEGQVVWPVSHFKMVRNMSISDGGGILCLDYRITNGYAICNQEDNYLNVQEIVWDRTPILDGYQTVANILGRHFNKSTVRFNVPEWDTVEGQVEPKAMIRCTEFGYNSRNYFNLDLG